MAAATCSRCGGRRWVRYFSETTDGDFEEAFELCPCNQKSEAHGARAHEQAQNSAIRVVGSFDLKVVNGSQGRYGRPPTF
jgi:predicted metal-binding protein